MKQQDRDEINEYITDSTWVFWKVFWKIILLIIIVTTVGFGIHWLFFPAVVATGVIEKVVNPDSIVNNYEEFQEVYNTCQKLDADMQTICSTPTSDAMFSQFSKGAMMAAKRQQMTRWVNEYNAKSKMITRKYWKSPQLPYQLDQNDFPNYNCKTT